MERDQRRQLTKRLEEQRGVIATWQLGEDGLTDAAIRWAVRDARAMHRGVYLTGHAPPTDWQRAYAATITEPGTLLARWSVAAHLGLRELGAHEPMHVVRHGSGGIRKYGRHKGRIDALHVKHSETLARDMTTRDDLEMTTPARALLDLFVSCGAAQSDRLFRYAIRLRAVTRQDLRDLTRQHLGERGVGRMRELLSRYSEIPIERTRSDPEVEALVILQAAGEPAPLVNVPINGFEADIVDLHRRTILDLDGPQYHQFPERDRQRNEAWAAAGFTVQRRPTDDAYRAPNSIIRGARGLNGT